MLAGCRVPCFTGRPGRAPFLKGARDCTSFFCRAPLFYVASLCYDHHHPLSGATAGELLRLGLERIAGDIRGVFFHADSVAYGTVAASLPRGQGAHPSENFPGRGRQGATRLRIPGVSGRKDTPVPPLIIVAPPWPHAARTSYTTPPHPPTHPFPPAEPQPSLSHRQNTRRRVGSPAPYARQRRRRCPMSCRPTHLIINVSAADPLCGAGWGGRIRSMMATGAGASARPAREFQGCRGDRIFPWLPVARRRPGPPHGSSWLAGPHQVSSLSPPPSFAGGRG